MSLENDRILFTRYGRLAVPDDADDMITTFLRRYGEWAWREAECVAGRLRAGSRVLDGGAYLGTFGFGLAQLRRLGHLCFVEANADVVPLLGRNAAECCHAPHHVVAACLAPRGKSAAPGVTIAGNLGATRFHAGAMPSSGERPVAPPSKMVSLAELDAAEGPFDLVKLDLEGGEAELLASERTWLARFTGDLWVECLPHKSSMALASLLLEAERPVWYYAFPAFNAENHVGEAAPLFPYAYESALLLEGADRPSADRTRLPPRCIRRPIRALSDLRMALWLTPRYAPPGWEDLGREALVAVCAHEMVDERYETFLETPGRHWSSPLERAAVTIAELKSLVSSCRGETSA